MRLGIQVDGANRMILGGNRGCEIHHRGCLSHSAFLVEHRDDAYGFLRVACTAEHRCEYKGRSGCRVGSNRVVHGLKPPTAGPGSPK